MTTDSYITTAEAAQIAGVTPRTIKRWGTARRIETFRDLMSGRVTYLRSQVETAAKPSPPGS